MSDREEFLAGERPEDVFMYFAEAGINGVEALENVGERVEDGIVLVVEGDSGRNAFQRATGVDPMQFAQQAMGTDGEVFADCTGGVCPASDEAGDENHDAEFVFAFAEEQNEDVEGIYTEGDVIHAYVRCACGEAYSEKWLAGEK
jgi:hypothetical protein